MDMEIIKTEFEEEMFKMYKIDKLPKTTQKEILKMKRYRFIFPHGTLMECEEYLLSDVISLRKTKMKSHEFLIPFIAGRLQRIECLKTGSCFTDILFE